MLAFILYVLLSQFASVFQISSQTNNSSLFSCSLVVLMFPKRDNHRPAAIFLTLILQCNIIPDVSCFFLLVIFCKSAQLGNNIENIALHFRSDICSVFISYITRIFSSMTTKNKKKILCYKMQHIRTYILHYIDYNS